MLPYAAELDPGLIRANGHLLGQWGEQKEPADHQRDYYSLALSIHRTRVGAARNQWARTGATQLHRALPATARNPLRARTHAAHRQALWLV